MADRHWTAATAKNFSDPTAWDTGVPGADDAAIFDSGGAGDCTLTGAIDVASLQIGGDYAGTFDDGGFGGTVSGDAIFIADAATINLSGDWTFDGDNCDVVLYQCNWGVNASVTLTGNDQTYRWNWTSAFANGPKHFTGSTGPTTFTDAAYDGYSMTKYVLHTRYGTMRLQGDCTFVTSGTAFLAPYGGGSELILDGGAWTGTDMVIGVGTDWQLTVANPPTIASGNVTVRSRTGDTVTLASGDYRWCTLECQSATGGVIQFAAGTHYTADLTIGADAGETSTLDAATNDATVYVEGDITATGDGTVHVTGTYILSGTADQTVDVIAATTPPLLAAEKAAGEVTILASDSLAFDDFSAAGLDLDADATLDAPSCLELTDLTLRTGRALAGTGTLRRRPGNWTLESAATLDLSAWDLVDWNGLTVAPDAPGMLTLTASAEALDEVRPVLAGTLRLESLTLASEGAADLVLDCATHDPSIRIDGDLVAMATGAGSIGWIAGGQTLTLGGAGIQSIDLPLSVPGKHIANRLYQANTAGAVDIASVCWTIGFARAEDATTLHQDRLRIAEQPRRVVPGRAVAARPWIVNLAIGDFVMRDTLEYHGAVLRGESPVFLAQISNSDGSLVTPAEIESAEYTVALVDPADPNDLSPVAGHDQVALLPADILHDPAVVDDLWPHDTIGYNFRHACDVSTSPAFTTAQRHYLVEFTLHPYYGGPLLIRYRLHSL